MAREWSLMLFMAADNDLGNLGPKKLKEITSVGATRVADVVAQFDDFGTSDVRRLRITNEESLEKPLALLPETDTGNPEVLRDFLAWCEKESPANRGFLVIWSHGSGLDADPIVLMEHEAHVMSADALFTRTQNVARILESDVPPTPRQMRKALADVAPNFVDTVFPKPALEYLRSRLDQYKIAPDWSSGTQLTNLGLKNALTQRKGRKQLDIVGFDACLMNTVEVAYQLRDSAKFIVGSQSTIPQPGWTYEPMLRAIQDPKLETSVLTKTIVRSAGNGLSSDDYTSMSALDLSQMGALVTAINDLADLLTKTIENDSAMRAVSRAHYASQSFVSSETVDLFDFCRRLIARVNEQDVQKAAAAVQQAIGAVVIDSFTKGTVVMNARGVSIFFPKRRHIADAYRTLDFAKDTHWLSFVESYLAKLFPKMPQSPTPAPALAEEEDLVHDH